MRLPYLLQRSDLLYAHAILFSVSFTGTTAGSLRLAAPAVVNETVKAIAYMCRVFFSAAALSIANAMVADGDWHAKSRGGSGLI